MGVAMDRAPCGFISASSAVNFFSLYRQRQLW